MAEYSFIVFVTLIILIPYILRPFVFFLRESEVVMALPLTQCALFAFIYIMYGFKINLFPSMCIAILAFLSTIPLMIKHFTKGLSIEAPFWAKIFSILGSLASVFSIVWAFVIKA